MRISPIKSIIRNLTDQKFTTPVNSGLRIVVTAKNTPGDTAKIVGDVFTLMDRTDVVEALASAILDGKVSLEYIVDDIAVVTKNTGAPNINSSVAMQERIKAHSAETSKTPNKPIIVESPSSSENKADTVKAQEESTKVKQVEAENPVATAPEAPVKSEAEPVDTSDKKSVEDTPTKPQRKQRQIKIN